MIPPGLSEALERALGAIDSLGLDYALVGGLAVSAWALPRATRDADLWVDLRSNGPALGAALQAAGFHVPAMAEELQKFGVFRSRDRATGVFIDIFDAGGPLGATILENRVEASIGDLRVWLARAQDLAILKAFSDRSRDFDDLVLLVKHANVNISYLKRWAKDLDASIGSDEVTARVAQAIKVARKRS